VGIGGGPRNSSVALAEAGRLLAVCSQDQAGRVRGAGNNSTGVPHEVLDLLLERLGRAPGYWAISGCGLSFNGFHERLCAARAMRSACSGIGS